uniref:Uncharacterized protein n=1 Tax=Oryza sativa subsp. japonica TaxID=39947 RepID=Q6ZGE2_ORYSJ|nr:hypothetical protein [Oryza sativa Japonica Group]
MAQGPFFPSIASPSAASPPFPVPPQRHASPTSPSLAPTRPSGPSATIRSTSQRWSSHHRHIRRETAPLLEGCWWCCHRHQRCRRKQGDTTSTPLLELLLVPPPSSVPALHARGHGGPGPVGELLLSSVQSLNRSSTVTANQSSTPSCSLGDICS